MKKLNYELDTVNDTASYIRVRERVAYTVRNQVDEALRRGDIDPYSITPAMLDRDL